MKTFREFILEASSEEAEKKNVLQKIILMSGVLEILAAENGLLKENQQYRDRVKEGLKI